MSEQVPTLVPTGVLLDALTSASLLLDVHGTLPDAIVDITDDSRSVRARSAFVAVRGSAHDGHDWLAAAAAAGATMAIVEDAAGSTLPSVVVRDGRRAAAVAAAAFHREPAKALTLIGVTGTNGKTTTVGLLRHLLDAPGALAASVGTLGVLVGSAGRTLPGGSGLTTPGPVELQRLLRTLVDEGVRTVAMEVSSHALDQQRVEGIRFAAAVFTNLTRDHLDYHGTMASYRASKLRLLDLLADGGHAIANGDDEAWDSLSTPAQVTRFGGASRNDVRADAVAYTAVGSRFTLVTPAEAVPVELPLIGDFNVHNALGASACALALGISPRAIAARLATMPQTPGRLERIHARPTVLRDYAHTPDALERALQAVRPFVGSSVHGCARLVVVFGCGGDRDRGKRPLMGAIAERLADAVIVTSDNPRTEDPEQILDDIEAGMQRGTHLRIEDRRDAIAEALARAQTDDVIVLAGKGHETYQIRGTISYPFDERAIVDELSTSRAHA